jgi:hypothetical protein
LGCAGPRPGSGLDAGLAAFVGDQKGLAWLGLLGFRLGLLLLRFPARSFFLLGLFVLRLLVLGLLVLGLGMGGIGGLRVIAGGGLVLLVGVSFMPFRGVGIRRLRVGVVGVGVV